MKTIKNILIALIILFAINEAQAQRHTFGDVSLKDTLNGSMKLTTGSLFIADSLIIGKSSLIWDVDLVTTDLYLQARTVAFLTLSNTTLTSAKDFYSCNLFSTGNLDVSGNAQIDDNLTVDTNAAIGGNLTVGDNLTVDSIFTTRSAVKIQVTGDDQVLLITSSLHIIDSDDSDPTARTLVLENGTTIGQRLRIIYQIVTINQCEIENSGNVLTKDGATRTFDVDRENMGLTWDGTYWVEDGRSL